MRGVLVRAGDDLAPRVMPRGMGQDRRDHQSLRLHQTEHGASSWVVFVVRFRGEGPDPAMADDKAITGQKKGKSVVATSDDRHRRSQGIGAAVARLAGARGYAVALTYQSNEAWRIGVVADIGGAGGRGDRGAGRDGRRSLDPGAVPHGRRDLRPGHRAGQQRRQAGADRQDRRGDARILDKVLAVNVRAPFLLIREAAARMATDRGGAGGAIVNVSSRAAEIGGAGEWIHYAASKGALDSLTVGAARELAARGIRVNAV